VHQACAQMAAWRARGYPLNVSVNVSGRQLDDDRIIEHIRHAFGRVGSVPGP
jgi:EAL domain-containing protein (putative c-di-GMP-specific phosphodiesterase class I)